MALGGMSYEEARICANGLDSAASEIDALFNQLKSEMNSLEEVIKSKGADELYATYKTLEGELSDYPNKVRAFKDFLNEAVDQYEADDAALANEVKN